MAPFNPAIKDTNDPKYGGTSQAISVGQSIQPHGVQTNSIMPHGVEQGDKSAEYLGQAAAAGYKQEAVANEGFGTLFKNAVETGNFLSKAGVTMVKKDIEDKVYQIANQERQQYTDILEKVKAGVGVKNVLADSSDSDKPELPSDVAGLPDTLTALRGAKDAGKISGSYYQSTLLARAKDLRAQYPGFREEIDQAFTKVTGSNPANAYIHSLVQDINRAAASQNSDKNRMLTYIRSNLQFPGSQEMYADYEAGRKSNDDVIKWSAPYEQEKYNLNNRSLQYNDRKNTREDRARIAGDNVDYAGGVTVGRAVDALTGKMGLNNSDDVNKLTSLENAKAIDPKQWTQYGQMLANAKVTLRTQMLADIDKQGYTKDVGGKAEAIKRVDSALAPIDTLIDRVYNHDFGGIYSVQQELKAQGDMTKQTMLNNPKIGPYLQTSQALKDIGGEQNLKDFNLDVIKGNFPSDFKDWYRKSSAEMATQYTQRTSGVPYTFNDAIDHLKENKVNNVDLNKNMFKEVQKIYDPKVSEEIRMNYAVAAFSPENRGMISKLTADGVDKNGKQVQGQNAVFQQFTSPEMTKAISELGKKNPQILTNYVNWAKETIGNELMNTEINNLKKMPENSGVGVSWDPKNHRFFTTNDISPQAAALQKQFQGGNPQATGANSYFNVVNSSVNRMNAQIYNFKRIAEVTGEDPDAFVLKTIADAAGPEALRNVNGIPYRLMRDMGLSRLNMMKGSR